MKKNIIISLILIICMVAISIPVGASDECIDHGPWAYLCGGLYEQTEASHTFTYGGYTKRCNYTIVTYRTRKICEFCGYEGPGSTHSHGEYGHGECGEAVWNYCTLS